MRNCWSTGSGCKISIEEIFDHINDYADSGGKIFIGTDSQLGSHGCIFATAICLHGAPDTHGGHYFFKRFSESCRSNHVLRVRMMREVQHSIDIALKVMERNHDANIEVHIDVGMSQRSKTREYVDFLKGWTASIGFPCKIKPNAWASASIADRHTK